MNGHDFFNGPAPATVTGDILDLSDTNGFYQYRSAFYNIPQSILSFTASFIYQDLTQTNPGDGIVFTLQNQGATAVGGALGYGGISQAAGVAFHIYGNPPRGTGYAPTAVPNGPYLDTSPVNLISGNPISVVLTYDGTTLSELLTDTVTTASFSTSYTVDLRSAVGGPTAFVGFTAGTGAAASDQRIRNFSFTPAPKIFGWGDNSYGQLSLPSGLSNAIAVSAGLYHGLALKVDSTVAGWGYNYNGQANAPSGLSNVTAVAAGGFHSLALKANGTVAAWGANFDGQTNVPSGLSNVVAISAGDDHSLALKADGTIVAWGLNAYGQTNVPNGLSNVAAIACGGFHSLALKSDGRVIAWGAGVSNNPNSGVDFGQSMVPAGLSNIVAIAAGYYHSLALKNDGTVVAWGAGQEVFLGDNHDYGQCMVPEGLSNVTAIAGGGYESQALKSDGTLSAWGYNYNDITYVPTIVPAGLSNVAAITVGYDFNIALTYNPPQPPTNDNFANATVLSGTTLTVAGSNIEATKEPGEPNHDGNAGGASVWWVWTPSQSASCAITTEGSLVETVFGIYTGSTVSTLSLITNGEYLGFNGPVVFYATAGVPYHIAVDGYNSGFGPPEGSITLSLSRPPGPANNNFANAIPINGTSANVSGSNIYATKEPNEPNHANNLGGASVWWSWTAEFSGTVTLDPSASGFDTLLAVYQGNSVSSLSPVVDNQFGNPVTFDAFAGSTYYIAVDGYNDGTGFGPQEGTISLSLSQCPKPKIILPFIITQNTQPDGIYVSICANVDGNNLSSFQWTLDSNAPTNTPGPCVLFVFSPTDDGTHNINFIVTNPCGFDGQNGDVIPCGICLALGTPNLLTGTTGSGTGPTVPTSSCGTLSANARWFKMIPTNGTGMVTVSTEGSGFKTILGIYTNSLLSPTPIACSGSIPSLGQQSRVTFNAIQGTVYWIAVDPGTNSASNLHVASGFEPRIASYGMNADGSFQLQSTPAPPIPYNLLSTTNVSLNLSNWYVIMTTNLTTNYPYLYYRETNIKGSPLRFYRIAP